MSGEYANLGRPRDGGERFMAGAPVQSAKGGGGPRVLVINLEKRPDRRRWMCRSCLPAFQEAGAQISFVPAVNGEELDLDGAAWWSLSEEQLEETERRWTKMFPEEPLPREELRRFYGRPVSGGEKGVFFSHRAAWTAAKGAPFTLILEDDVVPMSFLPGHHVPGRDLEDQAMESIFQVCCLRWASLWSALVEATNALEARAIDWHLLLLGRHKFGADTPIDGEHDLVMAGFSTCLHAYCVSARGAELLLQLTDLKPDPGPQLIPIDDLLPGIWSGQHPRRDLDELLPTWSDRGRGRPSVVAFREDLAWQLESLSAADGEVLGQLFRSLMRSDIDVGSGWRAAGDTSLMEHPLTRLECLRAVAMAGAEASEALKRTSRSLQSALDEISWRQLALALLQEQQNCKEEDPLLEHYVPGCWMLTCIYLLSGRHLGGAGPRPDGVSRTCPALARLGGVAEPCVRGGFGFTCPRQPYPKSPKDALQRGEQVGMCVDERQMESLSLGEFRRSFESEGRPLLVKAAAPAASQQPERWHVQTLQRSLQRRPCRCHIQDDALALTSGRTKLSVIRMPFEEYVRYMDSHQDSEPLYLFQEFEEDLREAVDSSFHVPELFCEDFFLDAQETPEGFTGLAGWLLVGPASSGSRWHFDPWGTAAWNLLFEGQKLWAFFPPSEHQAPPYVEAQLLGGLSEASHFYAAPPVLTLADLIGTPAAATLRWVLQESGDLVFIPSGWWHCT
ncbi:Bifunctional arginine demethylase and lysyl-hydroxylase JMJD6 (Histone arginine demethylase JMJD6) (JmjC domain-containing protein 6) (Jumonji domain-containing protein 6) (Lysyl-hydroxylase JMJD6) (Peptide-lysine 5-dioxygenase JMJD6) (Phosphatidylserine receptor) (Protein PTDSR), partial [Durusdinium trenchii]